MTPILFNYTKQIWDPNQRFDQELYFFAEFSDYLEKPKATNSSVRVSLVKSKQTWQIVTSIPKYMYEGIAKIGGFIGFFTSFNIVIRKIHSKLWQASMKRRFPKDKRLAQKLKRKRKRSKCRCLDKRYQDQSKKAYMTSKELHDKFSYQKFFEMQNDLEKLMAIPEIQELMNRQLPG